MTVDDLTELFERHRPRLRAVAYRLLGSFSDADDAVQEAWIRLNRSDVDDVANLGGWLTTVVGRICLDVLRSQRSRREEPLEYHAPDPIVSGAAGPDPEQEALLADSVGLALLVVLETLTPPERLAFVLHDLFALPFEEIGPIVGRSPTAAKMLASRARRRVEGADPFPDTDLAGQRQVVDAFLAAARGGDLTALIAVLDPDVVIRTDGGPTRPAIVTRGARAVAAQAITYSRLAQDTRPALINGAAGVVALADGVPFSVMAFTIQRGRVVAIDSLTDPERLAQLVLD